IPPLCLLLAAQFGMLSQETASAGRVRRWGTVALIFAGVFATAYVAQRVIISYRADDGALARFGATVREQARTKNWRYEVIGGKEEGLLLYLRRTRFMKPAEAVERWQAGALDALVAPAEELSPLRNDLPGVVPSGLEAAVIINDRERRYIFLERGAATRLSPE
ncbi:MAG: hypothetical protein H0U88_07835, partial [Chthoniobacterales bacterium]|nr:hypothetical protein [Chthoniobacterales bacterium]